MARASRVVTVKCCCRWHFHLKNFTHGNAALITAWPQTGNTKGGKYHCTVDLLFDWFGIICMTTDNFCFYLQNRLIQTSQTGGQRYSDTSPLSIPCHIFLAKGEATYKVKHTRLSSIYIGKGNAIMPWQWQSLLTCLGHLGRRNQDRNDPTCRGK